MNKKENRRRVNQYTYERMQRQNNLKNRKLYLIVGASGSGKDYIVDKICKGFKKKKVISRTTRQPRYEGENTHKFVDWGQAITEFWDAIAKTTFAGNRYYTLEEDLKGKDFYIIDPNGVSGMSKDKLKELKCEVIFLDINWILRAKHMRRRGDSWLSIIKRLMHDRKAFRGFKEYDLKFKSSDEMYGYFERKFK